MLLGKSASNSLHKMGCMPRKDVPLNLDSEAVLLSSDFGHLLWASLRSLWMFLKMEHWAEVVADLFL